MTKHVFNAVVTIRSYFGVFADIAKMWITLSTEYIMPGLQMVDECAESAGTSGEAAANALKDTVQRLQGWSATASKAVSDLAAKVKPDYDLE